MSTTEQDLRERGSLPQLLPPLCVRDGYLEVGGGFPTLGWLGPLGSQLLFPASAESNTSASGIFSGYVVTYTI